MATQLAPSPVTTLADAFPNSTKVYVEGPAGIRVPMREITLSGGEPPLRVYDTSGPEGHDARDGLPSRPLPHALARFGRSARCRA